MMSVVLASRKDRAVHVLELPEAVLDDIFSLLA